MWLCMLWSKRIEDTFENTQWRKVKQMQPMRLCIFSGKPFEDTFENAQWRKVKQMQLMWLCLFSDRPFEETFENAQWRKAKQMHPKTFYPPPLQIKRITDSIIYSAFTSVSRHMKTVHAETIGKIWGCVECGKILQNETRLTQHQTIHNPPIREYQSFLLSRL